jgi:hypothetical protein
LDDATLFCVRPNCRRKAHKRGLCTSHWLWDLRGPSSCHPDRPAKVKDGRCEACYLRDKYHADLEGSRRIAREKGRRRFNQAEQPSERRCVACGCRYTPKKSHPQNLYCSKVCRDRSPAARQRNRDRARRRRDRSKNKRQVSQPYRDADIFDRDDWACALCSEPIDPETKWPHPRSPSIDHVVPIALGGSDDAWNVQASHLGCNSRKGADLDPGQLRLAV